MNRKQMSVTVMSISLLVAAAFVTANSQTSVTPLYNVRMEQESSRMNFLPTAVNEFTYTAAKGYELTHEVCGYYCSAELLGATGNPCVVTIGATCDSTCWPSCGYTCGSTCGFTCNTCIMTCGNTCNPTCTDITCDSCSATCITCSSCSLTCSTC